MNDITVYNDGNGVQRIQLSPELARDLRTLQQFQITQQEMKNMEEEAKERITAGMKALNIESVTIDGITITIRKAHTRTTLNSKLVKEKHEDVWKECCQTSEVKESTIINYGN